LIDILKLILNLKCQDDIFLPRFASTTIRGAFGTRLKRTACTQYRSGGVCQDCLLKNVCIYSYIFENHFNIDGNSLDIAEPPHPFILMAPFNKTPVLYPKGSSLQWNLNVFGSRINEIIPYIILTAEKMGSAGLGRDRGKFLIDNIIALANNDAHVVYHNANKTLKLPLPTIKLDINAVVCDQVKKVRLRFLTPVRIKRQGDYIKEANFYDIIVNIYRRYSLIVKYYQQDQPDVKVNKTLLEKAKEIKIIESDLRWKAYSRYSGRQKRRMALGGFIGEMVVTGDLSQFLPLINIGTLINVGKSTSFGFGNMEYIIEK